MDTDAAQGKPLSTLDYLIVALQLYLYHFWRLFPLSALGWGVVAAAYAAIPPELPYRWYAVGALAWIALVITTGAVTSALHQLADGREVSLWDAYRLPLQRYVAFGAYLTVALLVLAIPVGGLMYELELSQSPAYECPTCQSAMTPGEHLAANTAIAFILGYPVYLLVTGAWLLGVPQAIVNHPAAMYGAMWRGVVDFRPTCAGRFWLMLGLAGFLCLALALIAVLAAIGTSIAGRFTAEAPASPLALVLSGGLAVLWPLYPALSLVLAARAR